MAIPITEQDEKALRDAHANRIALNMPQITWLYDRGLINMDEANILVQAISDGRPRTFGLEEWNFIYPRIQAGREQITPDGGGDREQIYALAKDWTQQYFKEYLGRDPNAQELETWARTFSNMGYTEAQTKQLLESDVYNQPEARQRREQITTPPPDDREFRPLPITPDDREWRPPPTDDTQPITNDWLSLPDPTLGGVPWPAIGDGARRLGWSLNQYLTDAASRAYNKFTGGAPPTMADADRLAAIAEQAFNSAGGDAAAKMNAALNSIVGNFTGTQAGTPGAQRAFPTPEGFVEPKIFGTTPIPPGQAMPRYQGPAISVSRYGQVAPPPFVQAADYVPPQYYQAPPAEFELPPEEQARLNRLYDSQRESELYELARNNPQIMRQVIDQMNQKNLLHTSAVEDRLGTIFGEEQGRAREGIIRESAARRLTAEEQARTDYWNRQMAGQQFGVGQEQFAVTSAEQATLARTGMTLDQLRYAADMAMRQREFDIAQSLNETIAQEEAIRSRATFGETQRQFDVSTTEDQRRTSIDQELRSAGMREQATMERAGLGYDVSKFLMGLEETRAGREQAGAIEREKIGLSSRELELLEGFRRAQLGQQESEFGRTQGFQREQLGQQESEFGRTLGLNQAQLFEQQRQAMTAEQLRERQFMDDISRFGMEYALEADKFRQQQSEYTWNMEEETRQFNVEAELKQKQQLIDAYLETLDIKTQAELEEAKIAVGYYGIDVNSEAARYAARVGGWSEVSKGIATIWAATRKDKDKKDDFQPAARITVGESGESDSFRASAYGEKSSGGWINNQVWEPPPQPFRS